MVAGVGLLVPRQSFATSSAEQVAALDFDRAQALAATCPDESSFRKLVIARLGYDPFVQDAHDRVRVSLTARGTRVAASIVLLREGHAAPAPRIVEGAPSECESLLAALATTLSIALHSEPARPAEESAPPEAEPEAPEDRRPALDAPAPPPAPIPAAPPRAEARLGLFASAAPVVSVGVAPAATLGGEGGLGLRRGRFSIEVRGRAETMTAPTRVDSGDRLRASIYTGALVPCGAIGSARVCGLLRLGIFDGQGVDLVTKDGSALFYAALGARAGYELRLGESFALEPSVEAAVPLRRITLGIAGTDVWTAPILSASAALALNAYF